MPTVRKMVGRKVVEVEAPKVVNQTIRLEIAFAELEKPEQVETGLSVVMKTEVERAAVCPFNTLIVEKIEVGETPNLNEYHLARPHCYIRVDDGTLETRVERLSVTGFDRLAHHFYGFVTGPSRKPYIHKY